MSARLLRRVEPGAVSAPRGQAVDTQTIAEARGIVEQVRAGGEPALRVCAERLGDLEPGAPLLLGKEAMEAALSVLPVESREVLERAAARIRRFALAQRASLEDIDLPVPGGRAGHRVVPVDRAGCYAPGGRYPLPSSVLMTAVTARAAGVKEVVVASPRPAPVTLAAAAIAGADALLCVGGAQAIAAMAYGAGPLRACDVIVGPGNRWVTAAKQLVSADVAIDMLAGPSELVIVADGSSDPALVAADLIAQAEHDPDAVTILVTLDEPLVDRVEAALESQLRTLPTAATARAALEASGRAVVVESEDRAIEVCQALAPEHLQLMHARADASASRLTRYGALFIGPRSAEVLGDYGAGPNHVLPTGGTARLASGLSVFTFLRVRTWLAINDGPGVRSLVEDSAALARLEGLEGHARAAEARLG